MHPNSFIPNYLFAPGLCQGKASWEKWLTPPNPHGYQKACHFHDIYTIFWDGDMWEVWEQQRDKNSEHNSKNKKCEFLMCCVLGHRCSLNMLSKGTSPPKLYSFSTVITTARGSLHFQWAIFCLSLTPVAKLAGIQSWRKCNGKCSTWVMTSANSWLWRRWVRKDLSVKLSSSQMDKCGEPQKQQTLRLWLLKCTREKFCRTWWTQRKHN